MLEVRITDQGVKLLNQIKQFVENLDDALVKGSGELYKKPLSYLDSELNRLTEPFSRHLNSLGQEGFIVYEAKALVAVAHKDMDEARQILRQARDKKGDSNFVSATARNIKLKLDWSDVDAFSVITATIFWPYSLVLIGFSKKMSKNRKNMLFMLSTLIAACILGLVIVWVVLQAAIGSL